MFEPSGLVIGIKGETTPMKFLKYILTCLLLTTSLVFSESDIYDQVCSAIRSGDSKQIAAYFSNTVELTILKQENVYSKTQAELILRDFLSKNTPKTFSLLHKGSSKEGTLYAIGNMTTAKGVVFRVSFFIRQADKKNFIQELRFETE